MTMVLFSIITILILVAFPSAQGAICYDQTTLVVHENADYEDDFGRNAILSGTRAVISAHSVDRGIGLNSGAIFFYYESFLGAGDFHANGETIILAADGATNDNFGWGLNMNGNVIAIANFIDGIYFLRIPDGITDADWAASAPEATVKITSQATNLYVSDDEVVIAGDTSWDSSRGRVHFYFETTPGAEDWAINESTVQASDEEMNSNYGFAVCIEGLHAFIGSSLRPIGGNSQVGALYIYSESAVGAHDWANEVKIYDEANAGTPQKFGFSVSASGLNTIVGAPGDNELYNGAGAVWFLTETSIGARDWNTDKIKVIDNDNVLTSQNFGHAVSIDGLKAAVSAFKDDTQADHAGAVFLLTETSAGARDWELNMNKYYATNPTQNEFFGNTISLSGNTLLVASDEAMAASVWSYNGKGAAYFLVLDCVDQCSSSPCMYGNGPCVDGALSVDCDCAKTFTGEFCETWKCNNAPIPDVNSDTCNCTLSGATGKFCTEDVDDCLSNPCVNGGTCTDFGADLFPNHNNEFNCSCPADYFGPTCSDTMCYSSPCLNNGTCNNGVDFACNCTNTGYEGDICETEVDECASSPCLNNGICTDFIGHFECNCDGTGFRGLTCADDIDDCMSSPCFNNGVCKDKGSTPFEYKCTCAEGFTGDTCLTDIDDCISSPCSNGATCVDAGAQNYTCSCVAGFNGALCEFQDAACTSAPCMNNGTCVDQNSDFSCVCMDGYEGDYCENEASSNACLSAPCQNNGTCTDLDDMAFECTCHDDYAGDYCEFLIDLPKPYEDPPVTIVIYVTLFVVPPLDNSSASSIDAVEEAQAKAAADFALDLQQTLLPAALGGEPADYPDVQVVLNTDTQEYEITIESTNPSDLTDVEIERIITDNPDIQDRVNGDIRIAVVSESEEDDDDDEGEGSDVLLIVIIVVVVVVVIAGAALVYMNEQKKKKNGGMVPDSLKLPA